MKKVRLDDGVYCTDPKWTLAVKGMRAKDNVIQYGVVFEIIDMREVDQTVTGDYPYVVTASLIVHGNNPDCMIRANNYPVRIEHVLIDELSGRYWMASLNLSQARVIEEIHNDDTIAAQRGNGTITIRPMLSNTAACLTWIDYLAVKIPGFQAMLGSYLSRPQNTLGHDGWSIIRACFKHQKQRRHKR